MSKTAKFSDHLDEDTSDVLTQEDKNRAIEVLNKNEVILKEAKKQLAYKARPMFSLKTFFSGVLFGLTLGCFGKQPSRNLLK